MDFAKVTLPLIFLLALLIRFLYFPDNVYFGYDQARDSYQALEILQGNLKLIGPPSSINQNLFHGALIYYVYAPIYFISEGNPEAASFIFRIINALGILTVFLIGKIIFNKWVGLLSSFIYAISYEQSQYVLFLSHPSLAAVTVPLFYLGLALLIFKHIKWGLLLAALGLGLSIQFHYINGYLILVLAILMIVFRKDVRFLNIKTSLLSGLVFLLTISSFILAEIKFHFRELSVFTSDTLGSNFDLSQVIKITERTIHDNFFTYSPMVFMVLILIGIFLSFRSKFKTKVIFLLIWFCAGVIPYLISSSPSYYYNAGSSIGLVILVAFLIWQATQGLKILWFILIVLIFISNLSLIKTNFLGPNKDFIIQPQMLTSSERQAMDFMYQETDDQQLVVKTLAIPLNINTTWSYLFEWYGKQKYGFVPIWIGPTATGFAGNLRVENGRGSLPEKQFIIIEPTVGINQGQIDNFFKEENYFTKLVEEKKFGTITVQERERY